MTAIRGLSRRQIAASVLIAACAPALSVAAAPSVLMEVWKDPACGCCKEWVTHLEGAGFKVKVSDTGNDAVRTRLGIDPKHGSCHTALVGGYAIEGHVPVREIRRLLAERPKVIGLAVPGMVKGSPGMEQGGIVEPYNVLLLHRDGGSSVYAKYRS